MEQSILYRSLLRVSVVVTAAILIFQGGYVDDRTVAQFEQTAAHLGAMVGMSASVAPTELNTITAGLAEQRQLLAAREAQVAEREIALGLQSGESQATPNQTTTYVLAAILFIQLVLIVLNYGLDYLRYRESQTRQTSNVGI